MPERAPLRAGTPTRLRLSRSGPCKTRPVPVLLLGLLLPLVLLLLVLAMERVERGLDDEEKRPRTHG